jgi:hypothetical protein
MFFSQSEAQACGVICLCLLFLLAMAVANFAFTNECVASLVFLFLVTSTMASRTRVYLVVDGAWESYNKGARGHTFRMDSTPTYFEREELYGIALDRHKLLLSDIVVGKEFATYVDVTLCWNTALLSARATLLV